MKKRYLCPHCEAVLNPNVKVVFTVANDGRRGILLLNARPGDYGLIADPSLEMCKGDVADFFCPVCNADLASKSDPHFVEIHMRRGDGPVSLVEFSRTYGKHATFIVDGRNVQSFGEDAEDYDTNFFGH